MIWVYSVTLVLLLGSLLLGLIRIWRGPRLADRLLGAQLLGTTGVAVLLILAEWQLQPAARDTALVLAMLAMMLAVALVAGRHKSRSS
ncbi:monovalent cation/H+ antiporter complex subunit F [Nitrincola tapanii]|jgi:multicomponent Na+:H+ antiporter subunit F|uniref:pH regulation protein F n=1 Tax=Nitrincola tapanii TaxID=1708751 RepID=A0A5A9WAQ4_9GAMM|nr:monovalent cation/H+ antiporter complex subunit F [Nitrincola tapanii]KAA0876521.1 pH regulation protein F [Nitrincola tapanii]